MPRAAETAITEPCLRAFAAVGERLAQGCSPRTPDIALIAFGGLAIETINSPSGRREYRLPACARMAIDGHYRVLLMNNIHFIGEWFDCRISVVALGDPEMIRVLCMKHATRRHIPVAYEHFTTSREAGVIGALTAHGMHFVVRTFSRHSSVIVDLFVEQNPSANVMTAMHVFDDLRDDFWPMRALLHRVQRGEGTLHRCGRTPINPTEVLMGPVSVRQHMHASGKSSQGAQKATVHPIRSATTSGLSVRDQRLGRHSKLSTPRVLP